MNDKWTHCRPRRHARGIKNTHLMLGGILSQLLTMKQKIMGHINEEIKAIRIMMTAVQRRNISQNSREHTA